jgi:hypothetical protein
MGVTCSFLNVLYLFFLNSCYTFGIFSVFFWDCLLRIIPRGFVYSCDVFDTIHDQTMSMLVLVDFMFPYLGTALWLICQQEQSELALTKVTKW